MKLYNKIGIGSVQFGMSYGISNLKGKTAPEEVNKILNFSQENGIKYIDTASSYGESEHVLGNNDIHDFKIISKFMPPTGNSSIRNQLTNSIRSLRVNSIYGYLAHRPLNLLEDLTQWDQLIEIRNGGEIKKIGFSLNHPDELTQLLDKHIFPDIIQVPYNYFDKRFEYQLMNLKERGCEIHSRSVFLQGLFFTNPHTLSSFFDDIKSNIIELQKSFSTKLSSSLLSHVLNKNFIDVVIVGVEDLNQLKQIITNLENSPKLPNIKFEFSDSILMPSNWP